MKKAYIAILMVGLAACSSKEIPITTTEMVAVIETTEATESTTESTEPETTEPTTTQSTEETEPPGEPTQAPQKPLKETEPATQETTPPEQTDPPVTTEPPVQTEPPTTEPPEKIDLQALIEYGREYAATTYGYEVCIGLRDGYYPPDDHLIYTMEGGYKGEFVCCMEKYIVLMPIR